MSNNFADLTSLFTIQTQYLTDLSAISADLSNNNPNGVIITGYNKDLTNKLNDMYTKFNNASPASSAALDNQSTMIDIIQAEKDRLSTKKVGIDNAYATQQRLIQFNESYREKNVQYINILIVVIITVVIYLALLIIGRNISIIPEFVITIAMGILFTVSFIIICIIYANIQKHDPMDFQKLLFVPPYITTGNVYGNVSGNVSGNSIGFGIPITCVGNQCCGNGTTWNSTYGNCTVTSGFTLMGNTHENKNGASCNGISYLPYTPFEFDSYAKI
jgi:hypothetical protein